MKSCTENLPDRGGNAETMKQQAFNPFLPGWEYIPDGEPRVFGDRLYLYGSHDQFKGKDFCPNDYVCWSAPLNDLSNWRYEGVIYCKTQDPRNKKGKMRMFAPDCVQGTDGRYYLYYQLDALSCVCVAVSENPVGPFVYYGCVQHPDGTPWGEKRGDTFAFDPGVLVDDDGRIFLYVGFSPIGIIQKLIKLRGNRTDSSVCLELDSDMKTVRGEEHPIVPGVTLARGTDFEGHAFFEASSIRKVNGKYCYVYFSPLHYELCYAFSDSPTGGFQFGGTLVSIVDLGYNGNKIPNGILGNTHGGMVEINDQWYIFYHRPTSWNWNSRQACAEKLKILPDGSISQVEVTSCGLNDGPLVAKGCYEARIACNLCAKDGMAKSKRFFKKNPTEQLPYFTQSREEQEENSQQHIANLRDSAWCGFKYFCFDGTEKTLTVTVQGNANGTLKVYTDRDLPCIASVSIDPNEQWAEKAGAIHASPGVYPLYFVYEGSGSINFSMFEIT